MLLAPCFGLASAELDTHPLAAVTLGSSWSRSLSPLRRWCQRDARPRTPSLLSMESGCCPGRQYGRGRRMRRRLFGSLAVSEAPAPQVAPRARGNRDTPRRPKAPRYRYGAPQTSRRAGDAAWWVWGAGSERWAGRLSDWAGGGSYTEGDVETSAARAAKTSGDTLGKSAGMARARDGRDNWVSPVLGRCWCPPLGQARPRLVAYILAYIQILAGRSWRPRPSLAARRAFVLLFLRL